MPYAISCLRALFIDNKIQEETLNVQFDGAAAECSLIVP